MTKERVTVSLKYLEVEAFIKIVIPREIIMLNKNPKILFNTSPSFWLIWLS